MTALPRGFAALLGAQFCSALADNALLIVAIAHLAQTGRPAWWVPLLKLFFVLAYVTLGPAIGPLADGVRKGRLMAWMNALKVLGAASLALGLHPLLALAVVGLGAAAYAPAKYGLITELVEPRLLVRANAWLEVSVVGAVLLGAALGGALVSEGFARRAAAVADVIGLPAWHFIADGTTLGASYALLLAVYGLAALLNLAVPDSGARYPRHPVAPLALLRQFGRAQALFWRDREGGRLSLAVTSLVWGLGAVLQFAVLRHAEQTLGLPLSQAAYLQAAVAVGVVAGAAWAGRHVALARVARVLPAGIVLGLLVIAGALVTSVAAAVPVLALVGVAGGLLIVPMNALLQHRGHQLLSAGRSVAVQGFYENASVLLSLALYTGLIWLEVPIVALMATLGAALAVLMGLLSWRHRSGVAGSRLSSSFSPAALSAAVDSPAKQAPQRRP